MITLNTDKGLIKVESWEDVTSRPGYMPDLDPKDKKLKSVIGSYQFKEKIRCGLSNCHTPHAKGYIAATEDGYETNIGQDCGKKYFGVDFETLSRKFDRDVTEKDNRERLWSFRYRLKELEEKIDNIRKSIGGDWVYRNLQALTNLNRGCPPGVVKRMTAMAKSRNGLLTTQRLATDEEVDDLSAIEGRAIEKPYYINEPLAEIKGLDALYPENDLRELLVKGLSSEIRSFQEKDIDQMSYSELAKWSKWLATIEVTLSTAELAVASGKRLLSPKNLEPLLAVIDPKEEAPVFRMFLASLAKTSAEYEC